MEFFFPVSSERLNGKRENGAQTRLRLHPISQFGLTDAPFIARILFERPVYKLESPEAPIISLVLYQRVVHGLASSHATPVRWMKSTCPGTYRVESPVISTPNVAPEG